MIPVSSCMAVYPRRVESVDSGMSPERRKEWPHTQTKRQKSSVTFSSRVDVRRISSHKGAFYLWYQPHEFEDIATELQQTVFHFRERQIGRATGEGGFCLRGLEDYTIYNRQVSRERRMKTALIVLLEQDRQYDEDGPVIDHGKLAYCLQGISGRNADRARRRAMNDEIAAARIFEKSGAQVVRVGPSVQNMRCWNDGDNGRYYPLTVDSPHEHKLASACLGAS